MIIRSSERPEYELIDYKTLHSNRNTEKTVSFSNVSTEKKAGAYSSIHLNRINNTEIKKNVTKSTSFEYINTNKIPAAKPPKPRRDRSEREKEKIFNTNNYNPNFPSCELSNENENSMVNLIANRSISMIKSSSNDNIQNNLSCKRNNNFMTNDNTSTRRSNSNQSKKSNTSNSSVNNYLEKRHQQAQEKLNKIKMEKLQKESEQLKQIPYISENSKRIVESLNQSNNVIDRLTYAKFEVNIC